MRYNGQVWREIAIEGAVHLYCIGGNSPNDVWVGGSFGRIFHYDGSAWTPYSVPDSIYVGLYLGQIGPETYMSGANIGSGDGREYQTLLKWDGMNWSVAEVSVAPPYSTFYIPNIIDQEFYTAVGSEVRKRVASDLWQPLFTVPGLELLGVRGLSSTNMLAVGGPGEHIVHYNGENAQRLTIQSADSSIYYYDVLMFETEAFAIGRISASTGYVLHGK